MKGVFALIPARSGSRALPHKNIRPLAGKPLIAWSIEAAKACSLIDRVVVSTDSEEYARIARSYGAETPFMRPAELAEDVPTELVVQHAIREIEAAGYEVSIVVTMQCTTPLIKPRYVEATVRALLEDPSLDSAMTVCEVSERPEWMFTMEDGILKPYMPVPLKGEWGVRQSLPTLYRQNGACYATRRDYVMQQNRLIGDRCKGIVMPKLLSLDIDTLEDFNIVEAVVKAGLHETADTG